MKFLTNVVVAGLSSVLALGLFSSPLSQAQEKTLFEEFRPFALRIVLFAVLEICEILLSKSH